LTRIDRLLEGNTGDVAPIGDGLSELRIHYGPGYRVYFANRGAALILLLIGGDRIASSVISRPPSGSHRSTDDGEAQSTPRL
jgi:putative addiction module killer protein